MLMGLGMVITRNLYTEISKMGLHLNLSILWGKVGVVRGFTWPDPEPESLELICIEVHVNMLCPSVHLHKVCLQGFTIYNRANPSHTLVSSANEEASVPADKVSAIPAM